MIDKDSVQDILTANQARTDAGSLPILTTAGRQMLENVLVVMETLRLSQLSVLTLAASTPT